MHRLFFYFICDVFHRSLRQWALLHPYIQYSAFHFTTPISDLNHLNKPYLSTSCQLFKSFTLFQVPCWNRLYLIHLHNTGLPLTTSPYLNFQLNSLSHTNSNTHTAPASNLSAQQEGMGAQAMPIKPKKKHIVPGAFHQPTKIQNTCLGAL